MKHLNNKGYMLVEIILAFVLTMTVTYFIIELTIKLKNQNDDLLVKTLVYTDQAVIYNEIVEDLYATESPINCEYINNKMIIENNKFTYGDYSNIVSEYAIIDEPICTNNGTNSIILTIPISVEQLPDDVFDVVIEFTKNKT